jgi:hypothetical protein
MTARRPAGSADAVSTNAEPTSVVEHEADCPLCVLHRGSIGIAERRDG